MKDKSNFRKGLERILTSGIIFFGSLVGSVNASQGSLEIKYDMNDPSYDNSFCQLSHLSGGTEEPNDPILDSSYPNPRLFTANHKGSKIISKIDPNELKFDTRGLNSNTPVNLELSLHEEYGNDMNVSNHENSLKFSSFDTGYDFGTKPITIQQQDLSDLNKDGDVDFYDFAILASDYGKTGNALAGDISGADGISDGHVDFYDVAYFSGGWSNKRAYPVYDIRRAINAQGGNTGVIPIPNLDGTYISEKPHANFKLYFDRFLSDLDEDGKVNLPDYAVFADEWKNFYGQSDINSVADISGPNGISDRKVDWFDMKAFREGYLKNIDDPNTW